ncbi:MAG: GH92 family glycosyl hydrolase [Allomuricauda sp.]
MKYSYLLSILSLTVLTFCSNPKPPSEEKTEFVDLVYPLLDTENSRWFFFSSACRPFGMVNLSPDTEIDGAWGSGYRYKTDTIKALSHIHAWQLAGLAVLPVDPNSSEDIFADYYSHFDHAKEKVFPGYHQLYLERHKVDVELTSTKRCGFHRYRFDKGEAAIMINLGGPLGPSKITDGLLKQVSARIVEGELSNAPTFRRPKPTKVFFRIELDSDIAEINTSDDNGKFLISMNNPQNEVKMKVGLSYTSVQNAAYNLQEEIPHWNFDQVVEDSRAEWNSYLGRIKVEGGTEDDQRRFYTDLWHTLQGRRVISDANGFYPDNTGDSLQVRRLPLNSDGKPAFEQYNSDSFWGAQWTIQTLWQLVYPEVAEGFVNSLLQYYRDGGLVPRGPAGGNYTYVMTGASSTPFIVGAYQKGIRGFDMEEAYEALKKNHMPGGIMERAGYEHKTNTGGGLGHYLEKGYVPYPIPEGTFGFHQAGAGMTLEYAYQDWCLAQMAKALGKNEDYEYFMDRSQSYRNVFDVEKGWMRPKDVAGAWLEPFDPYQHATGFVESNAAQMTWFVPHDLEGLAELMGGKDKAVEKLNRQFEEAEKLGFTSGDAHDKELHPEYSRIPINYGNQPSIETAFVFNQLGRPDLTQYWVQKVVNSVYGNLGTDVGYNGDEDQGLMGALAVLMKIGLFQMTGGAEANPVYEITTPSFERIEIVLNPKYYNGDQFIIEAQGSMEKIYLERASCNDVALESFRIHQSQISEGGVLKLNRASNPPNYKED